MALFRPAGVNSAGTLFPKGIGPAGPAGPRWHRLLKLEFDGTFQWKKQ